VTKIKTANLLFCWGNWFTKLAASFVIDCRNVYQSQS